jgi:hypothetical protein
MRNLVNAALAVVCLGFTVGCSQHLNRLEARHLIDAALKPRSAGPAHLITTGYLPGFRVEDDGVYSVDNFQLGTIPAIPAGDPTAPLYQALSQHGYITITPAGPAGLDGPSYYDVELGAKAGASHNEGATRVYDAGFRCYQTIAGYTQCQMPPLLVPEPRRYKIERILQDGNRARVVVRIPWKLTPLALDLKDYVDMHQDRPYEPYWVNAVRHHDAAGDTPATLWFQHFPSGWQIVDENGMTEQQFDQMLANR